MFDAIVQLNGWDDATIGLQLLYHLEGDALNVALALVTLAVRTFGDMGHERAGSCKVRGTMYIDTFIWIYRARLADNIVYASSSQPRLGMTGEDPVDIRNSSWIYIAVKSYVGEVKSLERATHLSSHGTGSPTSRSRELCLASGFISIKAVLP